MLTLVVCHGEQKNIALFQVKWLAGLSYEIDTHCFLLEMNDHGRQHSYGEASGCISIERSIRRETRSISSSVRREMHKLQNISCSKCSRPLILVNRASGALDKNAAYPKAFNELKAAGILPASVELRQVKYLNNLIEQDHRFIKRLTKPGMGFFSFETAWRTLQGFEAMSMLRKGQVKNVGKGDVGEVVALVARLFGVAA